MVWSSNAVEHREHDGIAPLDFTTSAGGVIRGSAGDLRLRRRASLSTQAGADQIVVTAVTPGMFEMLAVRDRTDLAGRGADRRRQPRILAAAALAAIRRARTRADDPEPSRGRSSA
jgi:hypothetical protein